MPMITSTVFKGLLTSEIHRQFFKYVTNDQEGIFPNIYQEFEFSTADGAINGGMCIIDNRLHYILGGDNELIQMVNVGYYTIFVEYSKITKKANINWIFDSTNALNYPAEDSTKKYLPLYKINSAGLGNYLPISDDRFLISKAGGGGEEITPIVDAEDTGFLNSSYTTISLNRNKFDKIIWSEIKRLKEKYTNYTIFYDVSKYTTIFNALEKIDIKYAKSILLFISPNSKECMLTINQDVPEEEYSKLSDTVKCTDEKLNINLVFEGDSVDFLNSKIKNNFLLAEEILEIPIHYGQTETTKWDSDLNFQKAGYSHLKIEFNLEDKDNYSSVTPMIVYLDLKNDRVHFGGHINSNISIVGKGYGVFGQLHIAQSPNILSNIRIDGSSRIWAILDTTGTGSDTNLDFLDIYLISIIKMTLIAK